MFARGLCAFCYTFWKMMYCKDIIQEEKSNVIFLAKVKKLTRTCANNFQTILRCTLTQVAQHCPKIWNTRLTLGSHNQRVLFSFSDRAAQRAIKKKKIFHKTSILQKLLHTNMILFFHFYLLCIVARLIKQKQNIV